MDICQALQRVVAHIDLERAEMREVMRDVMTGACSDAQIGALLLGLRMKGESIDEITAAAEVMRELATPVVVGVEPLIDVVGTGGDGANLFNISTAAAFVAAAAGAHVAKHGNRGVSSKSGSADVLEHLGVKIGLPPRWWRAVSASCGSASCLRPRITVQCGMRSGRAANSGCARCSISSAR